MSNFSSRLKELREINSLSMKELAKIIQVSDCAISNWENSINEPKSSYLLALSKYFSCSVDYLLGLEDDFAVKTSGQSTDLSRDEQRLLRAFNVLDNITREKLIDDAEFYAKQQSPAVKRQTIKN